MPRSLLVLTLVGALLAGGAFLLLRDAEARPTVASQPVKPAATYATPATGAIELVPVPAESAVAGTGAEGGADEAAEPAADVHGVVLDAGTREPLPDTWVALLEGDDPIQRALTDAEGAFQFALVQGLARTNLAIAAEAPQGRAQVGGIRRLGEDEALGREPVTLLLDRKVAAPVAGTVSDERTGEPVRALRVHVVTTGGSETVTTDGHGAFVTRGAHPSGALRISISDGGGDDRIFLASFEEEHFASPHLQRALALQVPIGPTYKLDLVGLAGAYPGPWTFRLIERRGDPRIAGRLAPRGAYLELVGGAVEEPRVWPSTPLRIDETGAWVRFPRSTHEPDEEWEPVLTSHHPWMRTRTDGLGTVGIDPFLRKPELIPNATVTGRVSDANGQPVANCDIQLFPAAGDHWHEDQEDWREAYQPTGGGSFEFFDVRPGLWRLVIEAPEYRVVQRELLVEQGPNPLDPIRLGHSRSAAIVEGSTDDSPDVRRTLVATLAPRWKSAWGPWRSTSFQGDSFRFDSLAIEEYDLAVFSMQGLRPVARKRVSLPTNHHRIDAFQAGPQPLFRIEDADGNRVSGAWVQDLTHGVTVTPMWHHGPPSRIEGNPWRLWAAGHRPFLGDDTNVTHADGRAVIDVQLQRGSGAVLHLREGEPPPETSVGRRGSWRRTSDLTGLPWSLFGHPAVLGVEVLSQQGLAGVSGPGGTVIVSTPARISSLVLRREGWRVRGVQRVVPEHFDDGLAHEYAVWMVRDNPEADERRARGED